MAFKIDTQGFLIGERRLIELHKGVDNVHVDTVEILKLLQAQLIASTNTQSQQRWQTNQLSDAVATAIRSKPTIHVSVTAPAAAKTTRQTSVNASSSTARLTKSFHGTKSTTKNTSRSAVTGGTSKLAIGAKAKSTNSSTAQTGRDAQGRFTAVAKNINDKAISSASRGSISGPGINFNVGGIDPTVDAVRELGTLLSPAKGAFRLMGRGAMWLYRKGKPKRNEDLPKEQQDHNTEVERNNTETRKLFRKLIDAVNRQRNGGGLLSKLPIPGIGGRNGRNGRNAPAPIPGKDKGKGKGGPAPVPVPGKDAPKGGKGGKLGKLGKVLGGVGRKLPLVGALVGGGMLASQWGDMDAADKGGGIGSMVGGGIGGVAGALLGPVGAVAGATLGSMVGDAVGQRVGRWTESLQGQDVGGTIVKGWNDTLDGINKMVKEGWAGVGKYGSAIAGVGGFGMGGMMLASYGRRGIGGGGKGYGGGQGGLYESSGAASSESLGKEADRNQSAVYNSLIKANFSKSQAMALTAEIGREGGYSNDHLFGTHTDQANNLTNIGMISWQGKRGKKLREHLTQRGVFKNGKIVQGQAALDAQAEYMKMEIDTDPAYAATKNMFANNPNADPEQYSKTLGKNYIGWAYGQDKLSSGAKFPWRAHDARRRGHLKTIEKKAGSVGQSTGNTSSSQTKPRVVTINAPAARKSTKPMLVSDYPKAVKPVQQEKVSPMRRVSSQQAPVMMASAGQNNISQLPADRDIAHAITGGLGMRSQVV